MSADFTIRQNDTGPIFASTLKNPDGNPENLTAATVTFEMRHQATGTLVTGACAIVNASLGQVAYHWVAGNTALPGWYYALFSVTYSGGLVETYPNDKFMTVLVTPVV